MNATLAPLLALAPALVAKPDRIEWQPDFEQALERADEQGRVVLVAVVLEDEGQSERLITEVYSDAEVVRKYRNGCLPARRAPARVTCSAGCPSSCP